MRLFNNKYRTDLILKAKSSNISGFDWEDVVQELDISLWINLGKFQGKNGASEKTFAIKLMQNRLLDLARFVNRKKRFIDSHHIPFSYFDNIDDLYDSELVTFVGR